jgi:CheY-like chemotaxis protein
MNNVTAHATLLLVDDEINNIRLLQGDLEDAGYKHFLIARDGNEAWDILLKKHHDIDVILLDRMMPGIDGMEVLKRVREHPEMRYIPVIMQTAAAAREQMLEGIEAGVYYYLTKPYDENTMLAIVSAALRDYAMSRELRGNAMRFRQKIHLFRESSFGIRTPEDAAYLSTFLAGFFPDPERVIIGLSELFLNAIEHGNLGIGYMEKSELLFEGELQNEIERRLNLPENQEKTVEVRYKREEDRILLNIRDHGQGFNWKQYLDIDPERAMHTHGRGIAMARILSFDALHYKGCGNEVECEVLLSNSPALQQAS